MGIIAKYKFNQTIYENFIPKFNSDFKNYTIADEIDTDGYIIRTIESDDLPTLMQFGDASLNNKTKSLLSILKCNTENITNMRHMFSQCKNLTSIDLSSFNTSQVASMYSMFYNCSSLTSLDLSNFNTNQVTNMYSMFDGCSSLTSLDLSSFNTSQVTDMNTMFYNCSGLTSLSLSNFDTGKVTVMNSMFYNCSSLTSLDLSSFNTSQVTSMQYMFYNCSSLTLLDLSSFNTSQVTSMRYMFRSCSSLTSLDLTSFNTENVTDTDEMFYKWTSKQEVYISSKWTIDRTKFPPTFIIAFAYTIAKYKFNQNTYESFIPTFNTDFTDYAYNDEIDTDGYTIRTIGNDSCDLPTLMRFGSTTQTNREKSLLEVYECNIDKATDMSYMFSRCSSLTLLDVSNFNTSQVTNMQQMFSECSSLTSLNLSNFDTSEATNMSNMLCGCISLTSLNVSSFNTGKVTTMGSMFYNCSSLTSLDVSNFDTSNVKNMSNMFGNCSSLTSLDVSNFNTSKVTNMEYMFSNCSSLTSLDVSNFNTENVSNMTALFRGCKKLTSLDLSMFNTKNIANISNMFYDCEKLEFIDMSNFDTLKVTTNTDLFKNCNNLKTLGLIYSSSDTINAITPLLSVNIEKNIYYLDASISELIPTDNINFIHYKQSILNIDDDITLRSSGETYDELDLLTGQLIQRIAEDGSILEEEIVKQVQLSGDAPQFYNDGVIEIETNEIAPTFEMQPNITNYYEVPSLKPNTRYTLFFKGVPTKVDLGGTVVENPTTKSLITSGEIDNTLWFDTSVDEVMLIEGDLTNRDVEYFTGIKSSQKIQVQLRGNTPYFAKGGRK